VLDFAGGTVVHINAGIAGLVACLVLGKRKGYGTENMAPHNLVLTVIGASLLWVGWFGFNAGSAVTAVQCRHGDGGHADRHRRRGAGLDVRRMDHQGQADGLGISRARSPAWSRSPRPRASSIRPARWSSASPPASAATSVATALKHAVRL
jgi:hypothetical protein